MAASIFPALPISNFPNSSVHGNSSLTFLLIRQGNHGASSSRTRQSASGLKRATQDVNQALGTELRLGLPKEVYLPAWVVTAVII